MTRRLVIVMTLLAAGVALALAVPMGIVISKDRHASFMSQLQNDTLATSVALAAQPASKWPATVASVSSATGARVVVVNNTFALVADSQASTVDRMFDRPEIATAMTGTLTTGSRASITLGTDLHFVAAPVIKGEKVVAAVRLSLVDSEVAAVVRQAQIALLVFVIAVMLFAALIAWLIARSIAAPLSRVAQIAERLPDDLSLRAQEDDGPAEVQAVASALNITAERLTGILERTQAVAADASHHLKTPLTGVRLRLEAIEDISTDEAIRAEAQKATAEVDRLTHRIDQVLALARTDAGDTLRGRCDASEVIAERVDQASMTATECGLVLELQLNAEVIAAVTAPSLARVVDELLGNAFEYARNSVRVTLTAVEGFAVLTVEDDGLGLPVIEHEVVFNRFVRGAAAVAGGSGLGLALVRETARACGGDAVAITSVLGGLAVRTTWPLA
ncbi:unannotated protein [freshwater metagenome]|uniref:Signal transduction histidine-protein kinase/phosphatase MprB n=1 Tax=freshwater metagenome TaxID=449393 RepID=A0A6J6ILL3_9ZZZZ|nr:HAMP domain-containing protein [Actinomycetota bacterium]